VPEGARFCPSCGTPQQLSAEAGGAEERRVVTVLFGDLVGFTSLSERADPERVKRLVDAIFEQLVADVESFGGSVDKVLGDAIIALFGAPIAHEDDAERAVRAGLAMQSTLRAFRDDHPEEAVRMRVGINTGEVLVGTLAGTDYTAMGDVVNTAARLQEVAPPGTVLVGAATHELCSPRIRFQPFEAVPLRGREQRLEIWQAVAVDLAVLPRRWESDVPFVGRREELAMLGAMTATVESGRSAVVAVTGEAGIGKSRLVREAVESLVARVPEVLVLEGACEPYGDTNVWWPVAGGLLQQLGLDRAADPERARERIVRRLAPFDVVGSERFDRLVELVLHLLGHPSAFDELGPAATREAVVAGIVERLRHRAGRGPVVIWIDDLQWAAPVLLELLESVARQLHRHPVLIATTARPDPDAAVEWPPSGDPLLSVHISLEPLPEPEATELVQSASDRQLSERELADISARSGGNPLFLIELARLADQCGEDMGTDLPGTLRALIAARLDQLTPSQRAVLDNAAIIGNRGRVVSLREFANVLGQRYDPDDLSELDAAGLLVRDGTRWRFRSDVVREVAYSTLTKQARAQRHAGVAEYLAAFEPGLLDRRAHHAATAAELCAELGPVPGVPDDIDVEAVRLLTLSARSWHHQGGSRRAAQVAERGSALARPGSAEERAVSLVRIEALVAAHDLRAARSRLVELAAAAEVADDRVLLGETARLLGTVEQMEGDLVAARAHLGRAVDEFRRLGDVEHLAEALRSRGFAEVFGGSLAEADRFLAEAELAFAEVGGARGGAWVQQHRAWVSFLSGDHAESERRLGRAIEAFERIGDRAGRAWSCGLLAYVHHFNRRNDDALELAESVLEDARQWGDEWGAAMMLNLQASVRLWRGQVAEARALAERALAGFRRIEDRFGMVQASSTLNRAQVASGRFADADRTMEEVLVLSGSFGQMAYPAMAAAGTAMHLGSGARAADLSAEAVVHLDTTGANVDEARVVHAWGRLLIGDVDAALAELLEVDVTASPFALAARATASALVGDLVQARHDADAIVAMGEVSYWDRTLGLLAGYAASTGADADVRAEQVAACLRSIDDVIVRAYGARVLVGRGHGALAEPDERAVPIGGWSAVADRLTRVAGAV
jgi:class 3 adenylate cyclase/tetratricopeptide (TPR) repeat protein